MKLSLEIKEIFVIFYSIRKKADNFNYQSMAMSKKTTSQATTWQFYNYPTKPKSPYRIWAGRSLFKPFSDMIASLFGPFLPYSASTVNMGFY